MGVSISRKKRREVPKWGLAVLALSSVSCVPVSVSQAPPASMTALVAAPVDPAFPVAAVQPAAVFDDPAEAFVFRGRTPLDELRSLDCLAQAIYYEAASESEDGQRAVAQVVLNRVRHPAWPNSVCGVVYQGPMRAGGGCQFSFTCDGSLTRQPSRDAWSRARALAAEALAGRPYAPVGLSTHYHTHAVSPGWAPRLQWTTAIGAHTFYRLPGAPGEARAFAAAYAGSEPVARPAMTIVRRAPPPFGLDALLAPPSTPAGIRAAVALPSDIPQDPRWTAASLPESTVRDAYRNSGQWRDDAPSAVSGH